jgi:hypothetical protein
MTYIVTNCFNKTYGEYVVGKNIFVVLYPNSNLIFFFFSSQCSLFLALTVPLLDANTSQSRLAASIWNCIYVP